MSFGHGHKSLYVNIFIIVTNFNNLFPASRITNQGQKCILFPTMANNCSTILDCTSCVKTNYCSWCKGVCTNINSTCSTPLSKCPYNKCVASSCNQCHRISGCTWSSSKRECVEGNYNKMNILLCQKSTGNFLLKQHFYT